MLLVRSLTTALLMAVAVAGLVIGCGDSAVTTDPTATYTPASLAQELIFRYKLLDPGNRDVRKPAPKGGSLGKAATKVAQAPTKDAEATSLDEVIRDIRTKAALVPGSTVPAVMADVAAAVTRDTAIPEADRKTITDRLTSSGE